MNDLFELIRNDDYDGFTELLDKYILNNNIFESNYETDKKFDINDYHDGITLLLYSGYCNNLRALKKIVEYGGDINMISKNTNKYIMHYAIDNNNKEMIKYILSLNKLLPNKYLFYIYSINKDIDLIAHLIENGYNINENNDDGDTLLTYITKHTKENNEILLILLNLGANYKITNYNNRDMLYYCIYKKNNDMVQYMMDNKMYDNLDDIIKLILKYNPSFLKKEVLLNDYPEHYLKTVIEDINLSKIEKTKEIELILPKIKDYNFTYNDYSLLNLLIIYKIDINLVETVLNKLDINTIYENRSIYTAIESNYLSCVKLLLPKYKEISNKEYDLAISKYINGSTSDILQELINSGADINYKYKNRPLLSYVIKSNDTEFFNYLMNKNVDTKIQIDGYSILEYLVKSGERYTILLQLLESIDEIDDSDNERSILLIASNINHMDNQLYEIIIKKTKNINRGSDSYSPLMYVSYFNNIEKMKLLLDNGADINYTTDSNNTALDYSIRNRSYQSIEFLINNGANLDIKIGKDDLITYVLENKLYDVYLLILLKKKDVLNIEDKILIKSYKLSDDNFNQLLELGVNIDIKYKETNLILYLAECNYEKKLLLIFRKYPELIKKYINMGITSYLSNVNKELFKLLLLNNLTVDNFKTAVRYYDLDIVKELIKIKCPYKTDQTCDALFVAFELNKPDIAEYLLKIDNSLCDIKNLNTSTPIQYACQLGMINIVKYLLNNNVDINYNNRVNKSAFDYALESNNGDIISLILNNNTNINNKIKGKTVLMQLYKPNIYEKVKKQLKKNIYIEKINEETDDECLICCDMEKNNCYHKCDHGTHIYHPECLSLLWNDDKYSEDNRCVLCYKTININKLYKNRDKNADIKKIDIFNIIN